MIHRQAAEISTSVQPGTPSSFSDWKRVEVGELGDWWWWWGWVCVYRCREGKCPCEMEILSVREKAESTRETELNFDFCCSDSVISYFSWDNVTPLLWRSSLLISESLNLVSPAD